MSDNVTHLTHSTLLSDDPRVDPRDDSRDDSRVDAPRRHRTARPPRPRDRMMALCVVPTVFFLMLCLAMIRTQWNNGPWFVVIGTAIVVVGYSLSGAVVIGVDRWRRRLGGRCRKRVVAARVVAAALWLATTYLAIVTAMMTIWATTSD